MTGVLDFLKVSELLTLIGSKGKKKSGKKRGVRKGRGRQGMRKKNLQLAIVNRFLKSGST